MIEAFFAGSDAAFEQLVGKYLKPVYNFLGQLVRDRAALDDLTQTTFVKAWRNIKRFDQGRNFKAWLFTIAKNSAYDHFKKKKTVPFAFFTADDGRNKLENIPDEQLLPDELLMKIESSQALAQKLQALPEPDRLILTLRYREELTLQEIAEVLGAPYNTVKSRHQRALFRLKEKILEK